MQKELKKILVIDDDQDIRKMIRVMLEYKGYRVLDLERAESTGELLKTGQFGLVIMDMLLSGMNGVDVCSEVKRDTQLAAIPVIMISAHPNAKDLCMEAGADEFLAKPFDMNDIFSAIKKYMPAMN